MHTTQIHVGVMTVSKEWLEFGASQKGDGPGETRQGERDLGFLRQHIGER